MKAEENQPAPTTTSTAPAGFGRRVGAIFYDLLLLLAVLMFAAIPMAAVPDDMSKNFFVRLGFQLYLLSVIFFYYAFFWTRSGQTVGLLTWRLRLIAMDGSRVTGKQSVKRFTAAMLSLACVGLGFLWAIIDRDKLAWHDRLSGTRLILLPPTRTGAKKAS